MEPQNHGITDSQNKGIIKLWNHRMGWVGRDLRAHLVPRQGHLPLEQAAQSAVLSDLQHCRGRGTHSPSGEAVPALSTLTVQNCSLTSNPNPAPSRPRPRCVVLVWVHVLPTRLGAAGRWSGALLGAAFAASCGSWSTRLRRGAATAASCQTPDPSEGASTPVPRNSCCAKIVRHLQQLPLLCAFGGAGDLQRGGLTPPSLAPVRSCSWGCFLAGAAGWFSPACAGARSTFRAEAHGAAKGRGLAPPAADRLETPRSPVLVVPRLLFSAGEPKLLGLLWVFVGFSFSQRQVQPRSLSNGFADVLSRYDDLPSGMKRQFPPHICHQQDRPFFHLFSSLTRSLC